MDRRMHLYTNIILTVIAIALVALVLLLATTDPCL